MSLKSKAGAQFPLLVLIPKPIQVIHPNYHNFTARNSSYGKVICQSVNLLTGGIGNLCSHVLFGGLGYLGGGYMVVGYLEGRVTRG